MNRPDRQAETNRRRGLIINALREAQPESVSGEKLAEQTGLSRTAVWNHIEVLRAHDYLIDSKPRVGYRLSSAPDRPYGWEMEPQLVQLDLGHPWYYQESVSSTNDRVKELGHQGMREGTVVAADYQTKGRGRRGRRWQVGRDKALMLSVLLRPAMSAQHWTRLPLTAAVAVREALISQLAGAWKDNVAIKWPNDVLIGRKKVAGILTETVSGPERLEFAVIGIGINVHQQQDDFPEALNAQATSLDLATGGDHSRIQLGLDLMERLNHRYQQMSTGSTSGWSHVLTAWKQGNAVVGRRVKVEGLNGVWWGRAVDVDENGALLLETEDGDRRRVLAGDVSIRLEE